MTSNPEQNKAIFRKSTRSKMMPLAASIFFSLMVPIQIRTLPTPHVGRGTVQPKFNTHTHTRMKKTDAARTAHSTHRTMTRVIKARTRNELASN